MQKTVDKPPMTQSTIATDSPARILVVEDEVVIALDIAHQLRELGYVPVGHATRGEQAVALAGELRPDLVLMDIQLAGEMDGISTAQALRTLYELPSVFLSAFSGSASRARAERCQPAGYMTKPFAEHELRATLAAIFGQRQAGSGERS